DIQPVTAGRRVEPLEEHRREWAAPAAHERLVGIRGSPAVVGIGCGRGYSCGGRFTTEREGVSPRQTISLSSPVPYHLSPITCTRSPGAGSPTHVARRSSRH